MTTLSASALPRPRRSPAPKRATPFLKWAGGKGRLLTQLMPLLPAGSVRMRHVEPFVGGGALFFARAPGRAILGDVNPALIGTYRAIRDEVEAVVLHLGQLAAKHDSTHYYAARTRYNEQRELSSAERAALFIYLNKTCFNGLHRVNRRGEFNVPAGRYAAPKIVDAEGLRVASRSLVNTDLRTGEFEWVLTDVRPGDFVYFDPPYEPASPTSNFTTYAEKGFAKADQERLRDVFLALDRRGCRVMLSNSDVPFIRELYRGFRIDTVAAPRAINCDGRGRGKVTEVVVRNY